MAGLFQKFFAINQKFCCKYRRYLPQAKMDIFSLYEEIVTHYMNGKHGQIVVDIGGGTSCLFAKYRNPSVNAKIIAVDISEEQLKNNRDVSEKVVADVMQDMPFENEKIDLVVSRAVLEHLKNLESFIIASQRILKSGGYSIHLYPSKFAPFALFNQLLPNKLSRKLLYSLNLGSRGICGFPSFYNNCFYSATTALLKKHGFDVVDIYFSYYQSPYFGFFVPIFFLSALYEMFIQSIGAKNLCAYLLVVARKKPV